LDDMEPVAPFDRVAPPGDPDESSTAKVAAAGGVNLGGARRSALYVPPYLYPDAFPGSQGDSCFCKEPNITKPTKEEEIWAKEVAKQLNMPESQVVGPDDFKGTTTCDCGTTKPANGQVYRWVKSQPKTKGDAFSLSPADPTFPSGEYWEPELVSSGGLVAPGDRLPKASFPPQAAFDDIPLGTGHLALGDHISNRYSRYIDQLDKKELECDTISADCTLPCMAGDKVSLRLGNLKREAEVLSAQGGNTVEISFQTAESGAECPPEAGCSAFRICVSEEKSGNGRCIAQEAEESMDWNDSIKRTFGCPKGTNVCKTVQQLVHATYLKKDGKFCRSR